MFDSFPRAAADAVQDALALLSPVDCAGCGRPDRSICDVCRDRLRPQPESGTLAGTTPAVAVHWALRYESTVRRVILEFKQNNRTGLARPLAVPLRALVLSVVDDLATAGVLVVPVPPGAGSSRRRGYDPVALLLRRAGIRTTPALRISRRGSGQKLLGVAERQQNRAGSMRASVAARGKVVVLVDDVVTTGATLAEAVRAIRERGGSVGGAVALASTPRRSARV